MSVGVALFCPYHSILLHFYSILLHPPCTQSAESLQAQRSSSPQGDLQGAANLPHLLLVEDTLLALQDLARAWRRELGLPIIGITGTNGKTTTKELLATVLSTKYNLHYTQGNLNNQIGVPLTLLQITRAHELAIK